MHLLNWGAFHSDEEVEVDVREWLKMRGLGFDRDWMFKLLPIWWGGLEFSRIILTRDDT